MKIDLQDAAIYGEWCSEDEFEYKVYCWFEKSSFQFFYTKKLIEIFGFKDCDEIESSRHFIPVYKTDVVALKKEFVENFYNKKVEEKLKIIIENDNYGYDLGYEVAFRILTQDFPEYEEFAKKYYAFEKKQLEKDAEKWCKENNIPYYVPYDEELKFDLTRSHSFALFYKDDKLRNSGYWLDKKNFHVVSASWIRANYGYQNNCDILKSGQFVKFYKKEVIEMEKEYVANCCGQKMEKAIEVFLAKNKEYTYEDAFFEFISNTEQRKKWEKYKKKQLIEEAKRWCKKNNIPYYISKDRPDHLGSQYKIDNKGQFCD